MMKKAGDILQETRIKNNLSIEDVFEGTKIRPSYIKSIEKSDYSVFHSQTSIRGFLTNYAKFLGLKPDNIMAVYRRELDTKLEANEKKQNFNIPKIHISPTAFVILAVVLIIGAVVGFFAYQYAQVSVPPKFDILEPADGATTTQDKIVVRVLTSKGTTIQINNNTITSIDDNDNYITTIDLVDGVNKIIVTATNGYNKQTTKEISVTKQSATQPISSSLNIYIKSSTQKNFNLSYSLDNQKAQDLVITPGQSINWVAKSSLTLIGPANMNTLFDLVINDNKISLLPNSSKQNISMINNQLHITSLQ